MKRADIEEILRKNPPPPWPEHLRKKKQAVLAPVSERMAQAVKANPASLRISAKAEDGVTVIERPDQRRPLSHVQVLEVDKDGRPLLVQHYDPATNTAGIVKYQDGYAQSGARHEYNPFDALKGRGDE